MTNCEKFNAMLNSCRDPQAMHDALYALAPVIREARSVSPEDCCTADMLLAVLSSRKEAGTE